MKWPLVKPRNIANNEIFSTVSYKKDVDGLLFFVLNIFKKFGNSQTHATCGHGPKITICFLRITYFFGMYILPYLGMTNYDD